MSNYLPDGRVPKTGAIQLGDNRYTITRCVAGGNSLCYFVSNETGTHYVIKEFYPSRYAYREESTGKICSIPGYEPVYDELKKRFRNENEYVNKASAETYQVGSYFEQFYDREGYALMRRHSKDLHSLSALIQEFCDNKLGSMDRLNAAIEIMISLLSALEKLHDTIHIIHFDLSLSNVLYSQSNGQYHASLMDFGSARKCDDGVVSIDQKLDIPGSTQEFGAPELAFSKQLTTAADIYSAGIIFYHLITSGIGCYSGRAIPPAEVLSRGGNLEMQYGIDCLDILPGVKSTLLDILCCATCSEPSTRYKCSEMLEALNKLKEIVAKKGIHREILLQSSLEKYRAVEAAGFRQYIPALFPKMDMNISGHMLITGDGGSGKSTFFKRLWKKYAANMLQDISNPIPLYIELQRFTGENKEDFILQSILSAYAPYYADVDNPIQRLKNLFAEGPYLLLLDGMNECTNPQGLMLEIGELAENPNLTICIATREKPQWDQFEEFRETEIPHLSEDVIQEQLHLAGHAHAEGRLLQTLHRPMMLALYLGLGAQEQVQTSGEILLAHHDRLITNFKKVRHEQKFTDLREFVLDKVFPLFAVRMDSLHFDYDTAEKYLLECSDLAADRNKRLGKRVFSKWKVLDRKTEKQLFDVDAMLEELQQAGLLRAADSGYAYTHQMYQEFYSALAIKQQMEDTDQNSLATQLGQVPIQQPILSILGDLWGEYTFSTKKDLISEPSKIEDWLQHNMRGKTGLAAQMVVRNLVDCMKYSRNNCITAKYDGLDLSLVRFYDCSLPKSSFKNAIVPEFAFVSDGHKQRVDSMAIAPRKGLLFTCEGDNFFCWDIKTGVLRYRRVAEAQRGGGAIDVSPDEQYVVITGYDSLVVINVDDGSFITSYYFPEYYKGIPPDHPHLLVTSPNHSCFEFASFLADSEKILLVSNDGVLWQISAKTGKQISSYILLDMPADCDRNDYFTWEVEKFVLSHKRDKLAVVYFDRPIEMYNSESLSKNDPISTVLKEAGRADVAFSIDDKYLIVYADVRSDYESELAVYSLVDEECTLLSPRCPCYEYPQGVTITGAYNSVVVDPELPEEGPPFVWDFTSNTKKEIINVPDRFELYSGAYMDNHYLFFADDNFCITFWDAKTLCEKGNIYVGFRKTQSTDNSLNNHCGILGKKMWRINWAGYFQMISPYTQESALCYSPEAEINVLRGNDGCVYWQDGDKLNVIYTDKKNNTITKRITIDGKVISLSPETNEVFLYCAQTVKIISLEGNQQKSSIHGEGRWIEQIEWSKHGAGKLCLNGIDLEPWELRISSTEMNTISHMNSGELSVYLAKWCFLPELNRIVSYRFDIPWCFNPDFDFSALCRFEKLDEPWRFDCDGSLCAWNIKTGNQILHAQVLIGRITKFIRVPGTFYVIAVGGNECSLWDMKKGREIATWGNTPPKPFFIDFQEEIWDYFNKHVVFLDGINTLTNLEMTTILFCQLEDTIVRWSADKQRIAIGSKDWANTAIIQVFGESGEINCISHEHGGISDFCLDEKGKHLIVYGKDSSVYCYDVDDDMLLSSEYERYSPVEFIWPSIDARDIDQCDFRNARFCGNSEEIGNTLRLNGAILD